jgi:diguanylate cyclase (GGDEF)-like protein
VVLVGVGALVALLSATASACRRAQQDTERLQGVLNATAGIQASIGQAHQDAVLVQAARELLPWRHVAIRSTAPDPGEIGRPLPSQDGAPRWLLARPWRDADPWGSRDDLVLDTLASTASVAIELSHLQAQIAEQALLDPLTSLGNRRRLDQELRRLCSGDLPFAVVVLDLDGFKEINDRLGHDVGDTVLEQVATRLQANRREDDVVTRLGGDEFVLLLPGVSDRMTARAVVDRIAAAVAEPLHAGAWRLRVRTSGGAALSLFDGATPQALLRRADERMYEDKQSRSADDKALVALWQPVDRRVEARQ